MYSISIMPKQTRLTRGFTLVELLIVIVVIAILAAITIVAYNGVQQRAVVASLQSDLDNANKTLLNDQTLNGSFPTSVAAANGGQGLKSSPGTTYQYTYNNAAAPQTYCLTATNGTTSWYIASNGIPTSGACTGQLVGGQIMNFSTNPNAESSLTGWTNWAGNGGAAYLTWTSGSAQQGTHFGRQTWTTATTSVSGGPSLNVPISAGLPYTASFWVRPSKSQNMAMQMKYVLSGTTIQINTGTSTLVPAGTWTQFTMTATAPSSGADTLVPGIYAASGSGASNWAVGDYIDFDSSMVTQSSTAYTYADGNTTGWSWSGTANNSTSYGPPV